MTDALSRLLAERDVILADGATGTNLFQAGLAAGEAPEFHVQNMTEISNVLGIITGIMPLLLSTRHAAT